MPDLARSTLAPYALWAGLLVVALVTRPDRGSAAFYLLYGGAIVIGVWLLRRSQLDNRQAKRRFEGWRTRLTQLSPIMDVDDDGHLYEWLDPAEWEVVFSLLEQTPPKSRSLRKAMEAVAPGITQSS